jgi:hypothetical protein
MPTSRGASLTVTQANRLENGTSKAGKMFALIIALAIVIVLITPKPAH